MIRRRLLSFLAVGLLFALSCSDKSLPTQNPPPGTPGAGSTPTPVPSASASATPTRAPSAAPSPTPTPVPSGSATVDVGPGGSNNFADRSNGSPTTTIRAGQSVNWVFQGSAH